LYYKERIAYDGNGNIQKYLRQGVTGNLLFPFFERLRRRSVSLSFHFSIKHSNPFGMMMPNRSYSATSGYRYGFNGKENDNEVKGEGNEQDYGMRIYDIRVGRFLSVDPISKKYPELTPYQFASNTPMQGVDLDGLEIYYTTDGSVVGKVGTNTQVKLINADYSTFVAKRNIELANSNNNFEKSWGMASLSTNSKDVGMSNEELNARSFMTLIRRSENNGGKPLPYNAWNDYKENGEPQTFTDKDYSSNPEAYKKHPGVNKLNKPHTQAGAYQIIEPTWNTTIKINNHPKDFGPKEQDRAFFTLVSEQEKYNPKKVGFMNDIETGNLDAAISKAKGTWTSLPGGSQQLLTMEEAKKIFKDALASELQGKSIISTPKGKLLPNQTNQPHP
jgi:RHS repeat-associated protein